MAENLSNLYKKSIKENTNINKHFPDVSPVIDNKTSKTIERTVIGDGGETKEILFPNLSNRYFELKGKNVDDLTEEEKLFIKGVEDWKAGKEVDFGNLKKEEEEVIDTSGPDVNSENMEDATAGDQGCGPGAAQHRADRERLAKDMRPEAADSGQPDRQPSPAQAAGVHVQASASQSADQPRAVRFDQLHGAV